MKSKISDNIKLKKLLHFIVPVIVFIAFSIFQSCMESVQPETTNNRIVAVSVTSFDSISKEMTPLRNSEIIIYQIKEQQQTEIKKGMTNENGYASFEIPINIIGSIFSVTASHTAYGLLFKPLVLVCADTAIEFNFNYNLESIECSDLNKQFAILFMDEGSPRLKQNTPLNTNKQYGSRSFTVSNTNTGPIEFQIGTVKPPFKLESVYINNSPIKINSLKILVQPGEIITFYFSVSTLNPGKFSDEFITNLRCEDGTTGTTKISLDAEVIPPSCDCEDLKTSETIILEERTMVGQPVLFNNKKVFVNNAPCTVDITLDGSNLTDGWAITSPKFPVSLAKGEILKVSGQFTPKHSGESAGLLNLTIRPQGTSNECKLDVELQGEGCYNSCPFIRFDLLSNYLTFKNPPQRDTISNRSDNLIFISTSSVQQSAEKNYYIKNPDSACGEMTLTIDVSPEDNFARPLYTVSPTSLQLLPGQTGVITVQFNAPTLAELNQALTARRPAGAPYSRKDSMYTTKLTLRSNGCVQEIIEDAIVTAYPDISPIINLRAYSQQTPQKPVPENEVYYFGYNARTVAKNPDGSNGPYPPTEGDIWIDVNDNSQSASPPQPPILKLVDNSIEIKLWKSNYQESQYSDVASLVSAFAADPLYNSGYGQGPISGISVNDVYAIKFNEMTYALIFIRRFDDGSENTSSKQSGIEFRSVYPIFIY